ncbi:MAG TPA: serine hydrolase domain-containing protein [Pyrinomonadaceae bacterium]|nr:serine hydrolase domain-containing protein [Pyrinomonadaceae bacterium]
MNKQKLFTMTQVSISLTRIRRLLAIAALLFCGLVSSRAMLRNGWCISQAISYRTLEGPYIASLPAESDLKSRVDAIVSPYLSSSSFSGDVLVARNGKVLFDSGYGLADHERGTPVSPRTRFYIASISKSFTAAAILLLQERGKLKVSDPLNRFVPDFPNGDRITVHHLLTHTSGVPDYVRFPNFTDISQRPYSTNEVVALFRDKPLVFQPGERSVYSNSNYVLLAQIVEKVSGASFADFLRTNFFKPLKLNSTGQERASTRSIPGIATGYVPVGLHEVEKARYFDHSISTGAGSLYSTPQDVNRWIRALFAGKVLKLSSVEQMYKPHPDGTAGYSWTLRKLWDRDVIIENGWDGVGFAGTLMYVPKDDLTVVVLVNLNISSVAGEIANNVTAELLGEPTSPMKISREPITRDTASKLAGKYKLGDDFFVPGTILDIIERDGDLYEQARNPDRLLGLIRLSDMEFMHRSSWGKIKFEVDDKGEVTGLLFSFPFRQFKAVKLPDK